MLPISVAVLKQSALVQNQLGRLLSSERIKCDPVRNLLVETGPPT